MLMAGGASLSRPTGYGLLSIISKAISEPLAKVIFTSEINVIDLFPPP